MKYNNYAACVRPYVRLQPDGGGFAAALYLAARRVYGAILDLEEELGIAIFERYGKRLRGLTEAGEAVSVIINDILRQVENLSQLSEDLSGREDGSFAIIGCTHALCALFSP